MTKSFSSVKSGRMRQRYLIRVTILLFHSLYVNVNCFYFPIAVSKISRYRELLHAKTKNKRTPSLHQKRSHIGIKYPSRSQHVHPTFWFDENHKKRTILYYGSDEHQLGYDVLMKANTPHRVNETRSPLSSSSKNVSTTISGDEVLKSNYETVIKYLKNDGNVTNATKNEDISSSSNGKTKTWWSGWNSNFKPPKQQKAPRQGKKKQDSYPRLPQNLTSATSNNETEKIISKIYGSKNETDKFIRNLYDSIIVSKNSSSNRNTSKTRKTKESYSLVSNLNRNDVITLAELESILQKNEFLRSKDLSDRDGNDKRTSSSTNQKKGSLAFPQPSTVTPQSITVGTTLSSSLLGFLIGTSVAPNLWMVGSILGALYGNAAGTTTNTTLPLAPLLRDLGRRLAIIYLTLYDYLAGIWFMYKTGQLSYEYYKTYATLDSKFQIQSKVDAWNARFQEGKRNFDAWERENEVGRKILAGLRTAWLVEERSLRKLKRQQKLRKGKYDDYRIVIVARKVGDGATRFLRAVGELLTGRGTGELVAIWNGLRVQLAEVNLEIASQRFGSGMAALVGVNLLGGFFAMAPQFLGIVAVVVGMVYPNWIGGAWLKLRDTLEETARRGRGDERREGGRKEAKTEGKALWGGARWHRSYEGKYYFFKRGDGSKRWYRTGQSRFFVGDKSKNDARYDERSFLGFRF